MIRLRNVFVVAAMATLFVGCGGSSTTDDDESMVEDEPTASSPETPSGPTTPPATEPPATMPPVPPQEEEEEQTTREQTSELEARKALVGLQSLENTDAAAVDDDIYEHKTPALVNGALQLDRVTVKPPSYGTPATVTTMPSETFPPEDSQTRTDGAWFVTTLSADTGETNAEGSQFEHTVVVYTDIERSIREAMRNVPPYKSVYDEDERKFGIVDGDNFVEGIIIADGTPLNGGMGRDSKRFERLITSPSFPSDGSSTPFQTPIDPDDNSIDHGDTPNDTSDDIVGTITDDTTRNISGTLDGASGYFVCTRGDDGCAVTNTGGEYGLTGTWRFVPSSGATVQVDDQNYMTFGYWKREENDDGDLAYLAFSTGTVAVDADGASTAFNNLQGTATYVGPAIGQYSIYEPASPNYRAGSFEATARLDADFADGTDGGDLSGTITDFDVDPRWSLVLESESMMRGRVVAGEVDWTFSDDDGDRIRSSGSWNARFYSDADSHSVQSTDGLQIEIEAPAYRGEVPDGVSGTFSAEFNDVGALIGAFGAHCTSSRCR